jgi:nucleotide-binding universal stress UspA family protein
VIARGYRANVAVPYADDMAAEPHLLIAYDGSDHASEAIAFAARTFGRGARATVVFAWEPALLGAVAVGAAVPVPEGEIEHEEQLALRVAEEGAQKARDRGLDAQAQALETVSSAWRTIVDAADREHPDVIVMGTRGLSGVKSLVLGSVSHGVAQHASFPVLIVPSGEVIDGRRSEAKTDQG